MGERLLMGLSRYMIPIPRVVWRRQMAASGRRMRRGLAFMSENHHRVRDFVVRELPRTGEPLPPELIAQELDLPAERVKDILAELEKRLTFLFRNAAGAVAWAYPVTVDPTPHQAVFSTGERLNAA
ncbi:MAG: hypothetical protein GY856_27980 [bacterium]|nr:hypothetical protein [bacterium]